ncbi:MAG: type II toxin-antitoxin system HicB family antitoxin [Dehalococcoidia bacterium]|nr:MAG: type II toxin-antitoxin system HicB family antitoxin [Dehalococcoidia bacterium]
MITELKRKPLEYYLNLRYPVTIIPDETGGYVAEIEDLPGCLTQGETLEEIQANMEEARQLWLESAYEDGLDIPLPRDSEQYSGKFFIRAPKNLHRKLDRMAKREGVSLNQFLVSALSHSVGLAEARKSRARKGHARASSAATAKKQPGR